MNQIAGKHRAASAEAVFYGISFNPKTRETRAFSKEDIDRELQDPDVFSWIDIESGDIEDLNRVLQLVNIDLVLVSHFQKPEVLPRIVERRDCLAFYLYEIVDPDSYLDTSQELAQIDFERMIMVLGADWVITYHQTRLEAVDEVKETCAESFKLAGKTPGFITFLFLQHCLYDYAHLNLANDNYLDTLEAEVLAGDTHALAAKISVTGINILTLKKLAASLHIVLMLLVTKRNPFVSDEARTSFAQMEQNTLAVRAAIDSSRDLLDGVINNIQAGAANRTSEIARVLTVLSAIVLPLTLISGIYGMNFLYMPELRTQNGYFIVLGAMALIALCLLLLFFHLGWIGSGRARKRGF